jgi:Bacterial PH domain
MGLPAKVLADDESALLVLRPHARRLVRPALVLLVLAPAVGYAAGAVPAGPNQVTIRVVVAALAAVVALRWVVWPFAVWWTTLYVLTDERLFERAGIVRRTGHDLPLRGVTDVVVAQRLGERMLRSGTLSVTTEGGAQFTMTDVPGVSRLQHGLLAVADDVAERLAAPPRRFRRRYRNDAGDLTDAAAGDEELGGEYLEIAARPAGDARREGAPGHQIDRTLDHDLDDDLEDGPDDDPHEDTDRPDRREVRRRERETARRLRALQEQVRRTPVPDSPVEDDAAPAASPAPPTTAASGDDSTEGARILPFPPRP